MVVSCRKKINFSVGPSGLMRKRDQHLGIWDTTLFVNATKVQVYLPVEAPMAPMHMDGRAITRHPKAAKKDST